MKRDYFKIASAYYLQEEMSYEEFDSILTDGTVLPRGEDYKDWDPDYLEEQIKLLAKGFEDMFAEAIWEAAEILAYCDLDEEEKRSQIKALK